MLKLRLSCGKQMPSSLQAQCCLWFLGCLRCMWLVRSIVPVNVSCCRGRVGDKNILPLMSESVFSIFARCEYSINFDHSSQGKVLNACSKSHQMSPQTNLHLRWLHAAFSVSAAQLYGSWFHPELGLVSVLSFCPWGFSPGSPVSSPVLKCPLVWMSVWMFECMDFAFYSG